MLKTTLGFLTKITKRTLLIPQITAPRTKLNPIAFSFCTSHKHDKHDHHQKHHKHEHGPGCNHDHHDHEPKHETAKHENNPKDSHHEHGPGCKHDHGHHHEAHHQHGPNCSHDHHHHAAHPNVRLSKLTFEELIKLETPESLKYAHLIYEQEEKKLKEIQEEKQHVLKNLEFYNKLDHQIKEKEAKLEENIKIYEEEAALSGKRAQKQVEESKAFAVTKIAKQLLEVADCIASCKKFALQAEHKDKYLEMIINSQNLVKDILKKYDIEEFDPTGEDYNPNFQESLLQIPTPPGFKQGKVGITMRTGYLIKGRLLRSARVGVFS